jgi:hypothetical protein
MYQKKKIACVGVCARHRQRYSYWPKSHAMGDSSPKMLLERLAKN